jgi:peptidoglycan/xylan/chitin deacetylase (PgdA/CDA1 family)
MIGPPVRSRLLAALVCGLLATACGDARPAMAPSPVGPRPAPSTSPSSEASPASIPKPSPGTRSIPPSLLGTQWYTLPTTERVVALTFDAGANADAVPSILRILADREVPATFFLTGRWVEVYPEYASQIGAAYPVANHSYSHPDLTTLSDAEVRDEITKGAAAIKKATGQDTHPLFRFPFGASNAGAIGIVNSLGYGAINWTVDTRGCQGTSGGRSADLLVDRVLSALQPGEIVIMHVGSNPDDHSTLDADALPRVIDEILARGYTFVAVLDA